MTALTAQAVVDVRPNHLHDDAIAAFVGQVIPRGGQIVMPSPAGPVRLYPTVVAAERHPHGALLTIEWHQAPPTPDDPRLPSAHPPQPS